jgi:glycine cleavage system H protein
MDFPENVKYTKTHEWAKKDGDRIIIGITAHAAHELGDIVFVELPELEKIVEAEDELGVVESVKAVSNIYAPVSGTVVAVNDSLEDEPGAVNESPFDRGWLVALTPDDESQLEELLDVAAYKKFLDEESEH